MTAELVAAIERDPYDPRSYAVYGDWLQQRGDPRGELIALQLAAADDPALAAAANKFLVRHRNHFMPGSTRESVRWRNGFIRRVTISPFAKRKADVLDEILGHPSGRFVAELAIGYDQPEIGGLQRVIDVLALEPRPALRDLRIGAAYLDPDGSTMQDDAQNPASTWRAVGRLGDLWAALPRLANLSVAGHEFQLGAIDAPTLCCARLATFAMSDQNARSIADARWPGLERLEVRYGSVARRGPAILDAIRRLLARTDMPKLVHLGITGADFADELSDLLVTMPVVRQLRELDLSRGQLTDVGATRLAAHPDAFTQLEVLDVTGNLMTAAGIELVRGLAKNVVTRDQVNPDDDRDDDLYDY
jgi:uncharacterized protein (TIGR02996 family)